MQVGKMAEGERGGGKKRVQPRGKESVLTPEDEMIRRGGKKFFPVEDSD